MLLRHRHRHRHRPLATGRIVSLLVLFAIGISYQTDTTATGFSPHAQATTHWYPRFGCSCRRRAGNDDYGYDTGSDTLEMLSGLLNRLVVDAVERDGGNEQEDDDDDQNKLRLLRSRLSHPEASSAVLDHKCVDGLPIFINRTRVGSSTIPGAGEGLFATEDCPGGTLLTCYPGDAVVDWGNDADTDEDDEESGASVYLGVHITDIGGRAAEDFQTITTAHSSGLLSRLPAAYMLGAVREHWEIAAFPELPREPSYLGHYANDGVAVVPVRESELAAYTIASSDAANAMHQPCGGCHMVTVATRDITKGDEIFVTYGPEYWRSQDGWLDHSNDDGDGDGVEHSQQEKTQLGNDEEEAFDDDEWVEDEWVEEEDNEDYDYEYLDDDNDFDAVDDEVDAIINEIASSSQDSIESPTRGKGFE